MNAHIRASFEAELLEIPKNKNGLVIKPSIISAPAGWHTVDVAIIDRAGRFLGTETFEYLQGTDPVAYIREFVLTSPDYYFLEKTSSILFQNKEELIKKTNEFLNQYNDIILDAMMNEVDFSNLPVC